MPYLPAPWGQAQKTWRWGEGADVGIPVAEGVTFVHPDAAADGKLRLEIPVASAWPTDEHGDT